MTGVCEYPLRIAYQLPININYGGKTVEALSRTFEDSLIYSNMSIFDGLDTAEAGNLIKVFVEKTNKKETFEAIKTTIFEELKKADIKAEFALDLIYLVDPKEIVVPQYIDEGLRWLENVLCTEAN